MPGLLMIEEPTSEQCSQQAKVFENNFSVGYAMWYPKMGGYCGKAVAEVAKGEEYCIDVHVWHDGDFPFDGVGQAPAIIHHCDPEQFIKFGEDLKTLNQET